MALVIALENVCKDAARSAKSNAEVRARTQALAPGETIDSVLAAVAPSSPHST